ncbi:MAG: sodium:solute symporter family protein [Deltaproteobacteria bacterium]|nr:MAG: sodium:solute symporter family protein [Deltaproteobacteria bacterium]
MNGFIIGGYLLAMILIGLFSSRKAKGSAGFFVADRKGGLLLVTGSLVATILGGSSTIGMAGLGYSKGLPGAWWLLVGCAGLALGGLFLAERVRKTRAYTLPEILGRRYGEGVRKAASVIILLSWLGIIAGQIIAAGKILSVLFPGSSVAWLMILAGGVMIFYTLLGGQYSILKTDTIQAVLIIFGIVLTIVVGAKVSGGVGEIIYRLPGEFVDFPANRFMTWSGIGNLALFVGTAYLVGPDIFSRFLSSRDGKVARKSALITSGILVFAAFGITWIGMMARAMYPGISAEQAFPHMILHILPGVLSPLVVAALLAAVMSSADTCLLTAGVILTSDILGGWVHKTWGQEDRRVLFISRLFVLAIGLVSLGIALYVQGIIKALLLGYTVFTSGLVLPALLALFPGRFNVTTKWVVGAIVLGGTISLWGKLAHWSRAGIVGMGLCALLLGIGLLMGKVSGAEGQEIPSIGGGTPSSSQPLNR